jgi:hypothetical protein
MTPAIAPDYQHCDLVDWDDEGNGIREERKVTHQ